MVKRKKIIDRKVETKGPILFVEDDESFFRSFIDVFRGRGYDVHHFENIVSAYNEIEHGLFYRVALIDLSLGGDDSLNGDSGQYMAYLSKEKNPDIPVIILTGYSIAKVSSAERVLVKPQTPPDLMKIIDEVIEEGVGK